MAKKLSMLIFALATSPFLVAGFLIGNAFWLMHTGFYRARDESQR